MISSSPAPEFFFHLVYPAFFLFWQTFCFGADHFPLLLFTSLFFYIQFYLLSHLPFSYLFILLSRSSIFLICHIFFLTNPLFLRSFYAIPFLLIFKSSYVSQLCQIFYVFLHPKLTFTSLSSLLSFPFLSLVSYHTFFFSLFPTFLFLLSLPYFPFLSLVPHHNFSFSPLPPSQHFGCSAHKVRDSPTD